MGLVRILALLVLIVAAHGGLIRRTTNIKCPEPPNLLNGSISTKGHGYLDTAEVMCNKGYHHVSLGEVQCQENEKWRTPGICKHMGYSYSDPAEVICDESYYPILAYKTWCQADGQWSPYGTCEPIRCPKFYDMLHGKISATGYGYSDTAEVTCDEGYNPLLPNKTWCQGEGQWSPYGTCEPIRCPKLEDMLHGNISPMGYSYSDTAEVTCDEGYYPLLPKKTWCQADGQWSPYGTCERHNKLGMVLGICFGLMSAIVASFLIYCYWRRRKPKLKGDPWTGSLPLLGPVPGFGKLHCFNLTLNGEPYVSDELEWELKLFVKTIKESICESMSSMATVIEVDVLYVCWQTKKAFIEIKSNIDLREEDIGAAVTETTIEDDDNKMSFTIDPDTIHFTGQATNRVLADVYRKGHIVYNLLDSAICLGRQYVPHKLLAHQTFEKRHLRPIRHDIADGFQIQLETDNVQNVQTIHEESLIEHAYGGDYALIHGIAGSGKSTMAQHLVWRWAKGEPESRWLSLIFMINVSYVQAIQRAISLPCFLSLCCQYNTGDPDICFDIEQLRQFEDMIGFILDGLDKVVHVKDIWSHSCQTQCADLYTGARPPLQWCLLLMTRQCFSKSTVIVTSRPFGDLNFIVKQASEICMPGRFKLIEVEGLTDEGIFDYMEKNIPEEKTEAVKQILEKSPILLSVSSNPSYCSSLCEVLSDEDSLPEELSTYTHVIAHIMQVHLERSRPTAISKKAFCREMIRDLAEVAYSGLEDLTNKDGPLKSGKRNLIEEVPGHIEIKESLFLNFDEETIGKLLETGLIVQSEERQDRETDTGVICRFVHLQVQMFLAVLALIKSHPQNVKHVFQSLYHSEMFGMFLRTIFGLVFNRIKLVDLAIGNIEQIGEIKRFLRGSAHNIHNDLHVLYIAHECQSSQSIKDMMRNRFQEEICLQSHKLTVVDLTALTYQLGENDDINTLTLYEVGLNVHYVEHIAKCLRNSIRRLHLDDPNINDECISVLLDLLEMKTHLRYLYISSVNMTDKSLVYIADMLKMNTTLEELKIALYKINDLKTADVLQEALTVNTNVSITLDIRAGTGDDMKKRLLHNRIDLWCPKDHGLEKDLT